ncbi:hypothetical protein SAMN04487948_103384 [Halogranum amylolyticum]|uniref:Uncharacterized protein n=2 Tax=Halogranum amylolyticum TaxID=660520 RepID=A0A1H8QY25_9EURY|nr:hypothetical protein SAMN04487948_103384 [Halogranum amylolyticum]
MAEAAERWGMDSPPSANSAVEKRDSSSGTAVGDLLPRASVDSRWWYWIAAVPLFALVGTVFGVLFGIVGFVGFFFGVGFDAGMLSVLPFVAVALAVTLVAAVGGLLTLVFPLAMYVDARAITEAAADYEWRPDPALYGLVALAGALTTTFVVTVPLALYYLYRRHETVGTP